MFNSVALDVVIGLIFIFLLYSLLATIVQEIIATKLSFRAKILEKAIHRMLEDGITTSNGLAARIKDRMKGTAVLFFPSGKRHNVKTVTEVFYSHPLIKYMGEDNLYPKPSYLSAQNFSKIMIDLLRGKQIDESVEDYGKNIKDSLSSGLTKMAAKNQRLGLYLDN